MSLGACKLTCEEHAVLWPRPRESTLGKEVTAINPDGIEFANKGDYTFGSESARMIERGIAEQVEWLKKKKLGLPGIDTDPLPEKNALVMGEFNVIKALIEKHPEAKFAKAQVSVSLPAL